MRAQEKPIKVIFENGRTGMLEQILFDFDFDNTMRWDGNNVG
jgi:hypothetical protein